MADVGFSDTGVRHVCRDKWSKESLIALLRSKTCVVQARIKKLTLIERRGSAEFKLRLS